MKREVPVPSPREVQNTGLQRASGLHSTQQGGESSKPCLIAVTYKEMHWENVILILLSQEGAATTHKWHLGTLTDSSNKG